MKHEENKKIVLRTKSAAIASLIAARLSKWTQKKFPSMKFSFYVLPAENAVTMSCNVEALRPETISFFTGYASCLYEQLLPFFE